MSRQLFCGLLFCVAWLGFTAASHAEESPYRMEGVVTDIETQQPVAKVIVQVLIESETDPAKKIRRAVTQSDGRYTVELPVGHGWAVGLKPPLGYCPAKPRDYETFATTPDQPIFTKHYQVRKGIPLHLKVRHSDQVMIPPQTVIYLNRVQGDDVFLTFSEPNADGSVAMTVPDFAGVFNVICHFPEDFDRLSVPAAMSFSAKSGFDPQHVLAEVDSNGNGNRVVHDVNGRSATVKGCDVTVRDGVMTLVIDVTAAAGPADAMALTGQIVDTHGDGIKAATVMLAFSDESGGVASDFSGQTDATGAFTISVPKADQQQQVSLVITHDGYGGIDTPRRPFRVSKSGAMDFGKIKLQPAASIRVRVVDPDGKPLLGAIVEPGNAYSSRTRIARTGSDGECQIVGLSPGAMRFSARFGTSYAQSQIQLAASENEMLILKLKPLPLPPLPFKEKPPLATGTPAPEWVIREWSDGQSHTLAELRGKVVVLDFWDSQIDSSLSTHGFLKELQELYLAEDVVFLSLHAANGEMSAIQRVLKSKERETLVGIDSGKGGLEGDTMKAYSISRYPTMMIFDRQGKIALNSLEEPRDVAAFESEMEEIAKEAGIPWPINEGANQDRMAEWSNRLQVAFLGRRIDEVLKVEVE